jgi:transcriptional regulator with GAF, ATPase, and Fis domain
MDNSRDFFERATKDSPPDGSREQHCGMWSVQNLEAVINEALRVALLEETPDQSLGVLLKHLGKAMNGDRTYIFEQNESGGDDNTYEWVADGVEPEKDNLQNVPAEVCASWYRKFSIGKHIVIGNLEDIRETDALQYENLKRQKIHSLVVVPLYDGEKVIGFYGVDNPPAKSLEYASNMLQTAAYFIVSSIRRRNLVRELQKRSYNVLHALSVDYLGIYQVNFDTGECEMLMLDGVLECVEKEYIEEAELEELLERRPEYMDILMTGAVLPEELAGMAECVYQIVAEK